MGRAPRPFSRIRQTLGACMARPATRGGPFRYAAGNLRATHRFGMRQPAGTTALDFALSATQPASIDHSTPNSPNHQKTMANHPPPPRSPPNLVLLLHRGKEKFAFSQKAPHTRRKVFCRDHPRSLKSQPQPEAIPAAQTAADFTKRTQFQIRTDTSTNPCKYSQINQLYRRFLAIGFVLHILLFPQKTAHPCCTQPARRMRNEV
jgi:hypothetical protein